jgi:hypothetical protein
MGYEDLANINRVIEFIHEYGKCSLKTTGHLDDKDIDEGLYFLENLRSEIINNI